MKKLLFGWLAMVLLVTQPALAQTAPTQGPAAVLSGQVGLAVSSSNARVALPSLAVSANTVTIYNKGSVDAYVALGGITVVASSGGTCAVGVAGPSCLVAAGTAISFYRVDATYVAAITSSGSTNLIIYQGTGPFQFSGGSGSGSISGTVTTNPGQRTIVPLDIATVTTGGTAVNALTAGHKTAGGFLYNPIVATIALCINEIGTASGTTSAGNTTCVQPGQGYTLAPSNGAVSVVTSDSAHPFSGYGMQ